MLSQSMLLHSSFNVLKGASEGYSSLFVCLYMWVSTLLAFLNSPIEVIAVIIFHTQELLLELNDVVMEPIMLL